MNRLMAGSGAGALAVLLLAACGRSAETGTTGTGTGNAVTGTGTTGTATTGGTGTVTTVTGTTVTGTTTVTGRFLIEGGPVRPGGGQPGERPLRGTVTFTAAGQRPVSVRVGRSGTFSVALLPGTYHVAGRSPAIVEVSGSGAQHEASCSSPLTVHVAGQHTLKITVTCIVP
jgi:hypothetical protein